MNSYHHAVISAKKHGGNPEEYLELHTFIDSSKQALGDVRHRALLHSTWGIFLCEKVFGASLSLSNGKYVPVRILAEEHIIDDLGFIPTVEHWLQDLPIKRWMSGTGKKDPDSIPEDTAASRYRKTLKVEDRK